VEKTLTAGVSITHLDSHQHLHMLPLVADQVAAIGIKYGINKIRKPLDPHTLSLRINRRRLMMANLYLLSWLHFRRPTFSSFKTTDYCLGIIDSGNINSQRLLDYLKKMRPGWYEIVFHPCTDNLQFNRYTDDNYDCQGELNALLDPAFKDICRQKNVELVNFSHLGLA